MKPFILLALYLLASSLHAEATIKRFDPNLETWEVIHPPKGRALDKFYQLANYSDTEWRVAKTNEGKIIASLYFESAQPDYPVEFDPSIQKGSYKVYPIQIIKVDDGWIAGYNQGEFGAAIYWFSPDGKDRKLISKHHFRNIVKSNGRLFIAERPGNMDILPGSVLELKKVDNIWSIETFLKFPDSVEAIVALNENEFVVVTSHSIKRFNLDKEITPLADNYAWAALHPNSITCDSKYVYVGMRQYVAQCPLIKSDEGVKFMIPNKKWINTSDNPFRND